MQCGVGDKARFFRPLTSDPTSGVELTSKKLGAALQKRCCFSAEELAEFGLPDICPTHFIRSANPDKLEGGDRFFCPAAGVELVNASLSAALAAGKRDFLDVELEGFQLGTTIKNNAYVKVAAADAQGARYYQPAGYFKEGIHHIEVGRHCEDELAVFEQLRQLDLEALEVDARRRAKRAKGKPALSEMRKLQKLSTRLCTKQTRLKELWDEDDKATGHAFVVFHLEEDRNKFARLLVRGGLAPPESLYGYLELMRRQRLQKLKDPQVDSALVEPASKGELARIRCVSRTARRRSGTQSFGIVQDCWLAILKCVMKLPENQQHDESPLNVFSAPEPDEVQWDNLVYDDKYTKSMKTRFEVFIVILVLLGGTVIIAIKAIQIENSQRAVGARPEPLRWSLRRAARASRSTRRAARAAQHAPRSTRRAARAAIGRGLALG